MVTLAWLCILVAGLIGIFFAVKSNECRSNTFWFLLSYWLYLVLSPISATLHF